MPSELSQVTDNITNHSDERVQYSPTQVQAQQKRLLQQIALVDVNHTHRETVSK